MKPIAALRQTVRVTSLRSPSLPIALLLQSLKKIYPLTHRYEIFICAQEKLGLSSNFEHQVLLYREFAEPSSVSFRLLRYLNINHN